MKFPKEYSLKDIAELISCQYIGNADFPVLGMNEIHMVKPGDIVFVDHPKYYDKALNSNATIILINKEVVCPKGKALLISDDPFRDFNKLTEYFKPFKPVKPSTSSISKTAKIGKNSIIQPNCFIGNNVIIGDDVTIHSGTVLGANAFYYKKRPDGYDRLKSSGRVVIENKVDLGALCTIDRGVSDATIIGEGSKLDNQIQIGHDTVIGKHCLIASQTGIAGCVVIEDNVTIWGQVGCTSAVTIGENAVIHAQSGISKSLESNKTYWGTPAQEARVVLKEMASIKQIPTILSKLKKIE